MLADDQDNCLCNRKQLLIDPSWFDPLSFNLAELRLFCLDTLQLLDNLIAALYQASSFLTGVLAALQDPGHQAWPKELKQQLKVPFAEC